MARSVVTANIARKLGDSHNILAILASLALCSEVSCCTAASYDYTLLAYPGAVRTNAYGINDAGQIVGSYYDGVSTRGYIYEQGGFRPLAVGVNPDLVPQDINNLGQVVGSKNREGFLLDDGVISTIGFSGTALRGINDFGQIVGRQVVGDTTEGFLYERGNTTPLQGSNPRGINSRGRIVGENGPVFGFIEGPDEFTNFAYPAPEVVRTEIGGINDAGQFVGYYSLGDSNNRHGFLFDGATYSTIDYPGSNYTYLYDINTLGQMTGNVNLNDQSFGVLISPVLTPVPEPPALALCVLFALSANLTRNVTRNAR